MVNSILRRAVGAAIAAGAGAAAAWAVRRYLDLRHVHHQRTQDQRMLHAWENEGGNLTPAAMRAPPPPAE